MGSKKKGRRVKRAPGQDAAAGTQQDTARQGDKSSTGRRPPLSRRRLWTFRVLAATLVPLAVLAGVELALRAFGYGYSTAFTRIEARAAGDVHVPNPSFSWRFFPRAIARQPAAFAYPVDKPPDAVRIFVLGGSAAMGDPASEYGFSRILEVMLAGRHPGTRFEVVNTAMTAINSHVVREIAAEVATHDADALVVYLGNNEVVGPFGPSNSHLPSSGSTRWIRAQLWARSLKLGQLAGNLFAALSGEDGEPKTWRGMEQFLEHEVAADDPRLQGAYAHFEQNLNAIIAAAGEAGVPTLLCTVGANLRQCAPFASAHRSNLAATELRDWQTAYEDAQAQEAAGSLDAAASRYRAALDVDDRFAELLFRLARCELAQGEADQAAAHFAKARDLDTLRFRVDSRLNQIVQQTAGETGDEHIALVDAAAVLAEHSPHRLAGNELFFEHVHLNFSGNYLLARAVLESLERVLAGRIEPASTNVPVPDEVWCARRLGLTDFDRWLVVKEVLRRLARPPFNQQADIAENTAYWRGELARLSQAWRAAPPDDGVAVYREALEARPDDVWLRTNFGHFLYRVAGELEPAEAELRAAQASGRDDYVVNMHLGNVLARQRKFEPAVTAYRAALAKNPDDPVVLSPMGNALAALGKSDEAIATLQQAVAVAPGYFAAQNNLGMALARAGELGRAVEHFRQAAALNPRSATAHGNLARALTQLGSHAEAVVHDERVLELNPRDTTSLARLAWLRASSANAKVRDPGQARLLTERLAAILGTSHPQTLDISAAALASQGDFTQAAQLAQAAVESLKAKDPSAAAAVARRLELYQAGRAFRFSGGSP